MTWPRRNGDFRDNHAAVEDCFSEIATSILRRQPLIISFATDDDFQRFINRHGAEISSAAHPCECHVVPSNDCWVRDHGPVTVYDGNQLLMLDFCFDGWNGRHPASLDNQVTMQLAAAGAFADIPVKSIDTVVEGGAIETDGERSLLSTRRCLLDNRGGGRSRDQVENELATRLGVERFLWLSHGELPGDDTDGHIDTLARFVAVDAIAFQACDDPNDEHFDELSAMADELRQFRQSNGDPYRLLPLPWPPAQYSNDGRRLPAGYANFLVINGAVLVPVFGVETDADACVTLATCFPDREVVPIDCRPLITQNGSLHCVTMQIPAPQPAHSS